MYCKCIVRYHKVLSCITKYCQVSQSIVRYCQVSQRIVRYCQELSQLTPKRSIKQIFFLNFFIKSHMVSFRIVKNMLSTFKYYVGIAKYHQVLQSIKIVQYICRMKQVFVKYCWHCQVSSCITRYCEGSKKHLDDLVPNSDFPVLHYLGIGSSVSDIGSYHIGRYISKI
jgi:hypothetical protein